MTTAYVNSSQEGVEFTSGTMPLMTLPDGLYRGRGSWWISHVWKGVMFDAVESRGSHVYVNVATQERYPFSMRLDSWTKADGGGYLRLDYDGFGNSKNGSRLRDEVRAMPDGTLRARLVFELIPDVPYALRIISLEKQPHE